MIKIITLLDEIKDEIVDNGIIDILDSNMDDIITKHKLTGFIEHLNVDDLLNNLINEEFIYKLSEIINYKMQVNMGLYIIDEYINYINELIILQNRKLLAEMFYNKIYKDNIIYNVIFR